MKILIPVGVAAAVIIAAAAVLALPPNEISPDAEPDPVQVRAPEPAMPEDPGQAPEPTDDPGSLTDRTVYYSVEEVPDVPDVDVIMPALEKSMRMWEGANPGLEYAESDRPDIKFVWHTSATDYWQGYATCEDWYGHPIDCVIDIVVGDFSCNGTYYTKPEGVLVNLMMHEIGHTFGLDHAVDMKHLMYDERDQTDPYDERGIIIPDRVRDLYDVLDEAGDGFNAELEILDGRLAALDAEYDRITALEEVRDGLDAQYNAKLGSGTRDMELYDRLVSMDAEIDGAWARYEPVLDEYNGDSDEYNSRWYPHNAEWERANAWTDDKCVHVEPESDTPAK